MASPFAIYLAIEIQERKADKIRGLQIRCRMGIGANRVKGKSSGLGHGTVFGHMPDYRARTVFPRKAVGRVRRPSSCVGITRAQHLTPMVASYSGRLLRSFESRPSGPLLMGSGCGSGLSGRHTLGLVYCLRKAGASGETRIPGEGNPGKASRKYLLLACNKVSPMRKFE